MGGDKEVLRDEIIYVSAFRTFFYSEVSDRH